MLRKAKKNNYTTSISILKGRTELQACRITATGWYNYYFRSPILKIKCSKN
jgi:hypothetical protein